MKRAILHPRLDGEPEISEFEGWFLECAAEAINNDLGPDYYLWDMRQPGVWAKLMAFGLSPKEAVQSQFCRQ